jgi:hypothetical protein
MTKAANKKLERKGPEMDSACALFFYIGTKGTERSEEGKYAKIRISGYF